MNSSDNNKSSNIPAYDPSKPMNSKREVSQSPDEKTDQDFPGYPHYPAKEEVMHKSTGSHQVDANVADTGTGPNSTGVNQRYATGQEENPTDASNQHSQDTAGNNDVVQGKNEEFGVPQNVTKEDLNKDKDLPGTDIEEAAEKGSTNP